MKGVVKNIDKIKHFGFITVEGENSADGSKKDYFFHSSDVADDGFNNLEKGSVVTFEEADGPKGPKAVKVQMDGGDQAMAA